MSFFSNFGQSLLCTVHCRETNRIQADYSCCGMRLGLRYLSSHSPSLWNLERHVQSDQSELALLLSARASLMYHVLLCNEPMLVQVIGNEIRKPWDMYLEASTSRGIRWVKFLGFHEANHEANLENHEAIQGLAPFGDLCPTYRMEPRWTKTNQDEPRSNLAGPLHSIAFHCIPLHSIALVALKCSASFNRMVSPKPAAICQLGAKAPRFLLQKVKWPAQIVDWPGTYCLTLRRECIECKSIWH